MADKFFDFLAKHITKAYFIIILLTIFAPLLFVQKWTNVDFTTTGQIGDTIGGLTSPFLNFLSVTLLYLTLKEQMNFNIKQVKIEEKNSDYEIVSNLVRQIRQEINELSIILIQEDGSSREVKGINTLFELANIAKAGSLRQVTDQNSLKAFLLSFSYIIFSVEQFLNRNHSAKISNDEKELFYSIVSKYKTPFFMLTDAIHKYAHRNEKIAKEDEELCLFGQLKKALQPEFEKYKFERTAQNINSCVEAKQ